LDLNLRIDRKLSLLISENFLDRQPVTPDLATKILDRIEPIAKATRRNIENTNEAREGVFAVALQLSHRLRASAPDLAMRAAKTAFYAQTWSQADRHDSGRVDPTRLGKEWKNTREPLLLQTLAECLGANKYGFDNHAYMTKPQMPIEGQRAILEALKAARPSPARDAAKLAFASNSGLGIEIIKEMLSPIDAEPPVDVVFFTSLMKNPKAKPFLTLPT
jgi:hypothetical protein